MTIVPTLRVGHAVRDALRHKSALQRAVEIGPQSALAAQCLEFLDDGRG
ncbi:DUF1534 domain-containing protein [Pseudomonas syringae]|nr:DUF1534 domain-containing protein [Pseudomonas syringae]MCF5316565.1 DUF1534 domain-containing protein [Pseudomonas syringae]MCF5365169.1 DUF1534 domain-containing protein [Pseudomonas syringae]MCF5388616.1 DUF1534 domain-containing protein [Pseudomonas syringae]MCF5397298.1 DUF1534 domain-containing protein [Pseudomonas syringae]